MEYLDLAVDSPNHFSADAIGIKTGVQAQPTEAQRYENGVSARLVKQFLAADVIVIGAPFYNFSIPTQLKAWIDRLAQIGLTFKYTDKGRWVWQPARPSSWPPRGVASIQPARADRRWSTRRAI